MTWRLAFFLAGVAYLALFAFFYWFVHRVKNRIDGLEAENAMLRGIPLTERYPDIEVAPSGTVEKFMEGIHPRQAGK
jgi:hypothetical protein